MLAGDPQFAGGLWSTFVGVGYEVISCDPRKVYMSYQVFWALGYLLVPCLSLLLPTWTYLQVGVLNPT